MDPPTQGTGSRAIPDPILGIGGREEGPIRGILISYYL